MRQCKHMQQLEWKQRGVELLVAYEERTKSGAEREKRFLHIQRNINDNWCQTRPTTTPFRGDNIA